MRTTARTDPLTEIVLITDPVADDASRDVVRSIAGCRRLEGSPAADLTPAGSRSVFVLTHNELAMGGIEARIDLLQTYGIGVHRVLGEHPAVSRANRRLGYA